MELIISLGGVVRTIYGESIDLAALGPLSIRRASHVEPLEDGRWLADLTPIDGQTILGPFVRRSEALAAEVQWLDAHWLDAGFLL